MFGSLIDTLIQTLRCLPGVGKKSAQRMALHLLERDKPGALKLAQTILEAVEKIGRCDCCHSLAEESLCPICSSGRRHSRQVCVVETPADLFAIEQADPGAFFV